MINNSKIKVSEFEHFESVSNPDDLILIQEFIKNPNIDENKEKIMDFFAKMNVEINVNELSTAMKKHY